MTSLDPHVPLVLDVRDLGRRAGAMKTKTFNVTLVEELGIGVISVAQDSEVEFDLRLESVMEGVLVTGTALVTVTGECSRCLEPLSYDLEVDLQELYEYPDTDHRGRVVEDELDNEDVLKVEDDLIDLEPLLRDAVVLALPIQPLCKSDCLGLCVECGQNLNEQPEHQHEITDPRWSALADLTRPEPRSQD
ncbi:MAG: DUF177 domain-containing protein [Actinobacteria bacterium]|nr:DUF177 domain-containing protein [Actinomycetota bacterium]NBY14911.1 DUF177 domain-containing protein [Actinomycetota bacterium]